METGTFRLDHISIACSSLEATVERYTQRGFLTYNGGFTGFPNTRFAHIRFGNGTGVQFIEMRFSRRYRWKRNRVYKRFARRGAESGSLVNAVRTFHAFDRGASGYKGYALTAPDNEEVHDHLSDCGYIFAGVTDYVGPTGVSITYNTFVSLESQGDPIVYTGSPPEGDIQPNACTGLFRVEIGAREPADAVRRIARLTGSSVLEGVSADVPRPTLRIGEVNLEIRSVDTGLEEGVVETGIQAGFRGHNVLYAPETNDDAVLHVSYRSVAPESEPENEV